MARPNIFERQHDTKWRDDTDREMSLVLAFERAGYTRDQSRRMAERHRIGESPLSNHNGGPELD